MGKDKRPWRKLVKKLKRKRIRQELARVRDAELQNSESDDDDLSESEEQFRKEEEAKWLEREKLAQLEFQLKKAEEEHKRDAEEADKERIRKEWDEIQAKQEAERKEKERLEEEKRLKQVLCLVNGFSKNEQDFNQFLDFLTGDSENPPLPYLMPNDPTAGEVPLCPWYIKTAACRFGSRCNKSHPKPELSQAVLIPNFFSHISLEKAFQDDTDQNLEYENSELYREFLAFYYDVLPELKSVGDVIQFKVCCNVEPHLRGNVYVQFRTIREAVDAYRKFNGRFYDGKQLSLGFIKIDSWRSAICGAFQRKRCPKVRTCNYLHVFRNPTKEFVRADNDWKTFPEPSPRLATPRRPTLSSTPHRVTQTPTPRQESVPPAASSQNVKPDERSAGTRKRYDEDRKRQHRDERSRSASYKRRRHDSSDSDRSRTSRKHSRRKDSKKHKKHKHKHKHKKKKSKDKTSPRKD